MIAIPVSSITGDGISELLQAIEAKLDQGRKSFIAKLTNRDGALRAWLHEHSQVEDEEFGETGDARLVVSLTKDEFGRLAARFPDAAATKFEHMEPPA